MGGHLNRIKNKVLAKIAARIPVVADLLASAYTPLESPLEKIPWTPVTKPLREARIAVVTTAGVHHSHHPPFDMGDRDGDPSYRRLDRDTINSDYAITHDYYDHRDADRDLNIVLPLDRLAEMEAASHIGSVAQYHYSFMGHITGHHIDSLVGSKAPEVASLLNRNQVDLVLLTPG